MRLCLFLFLFGCAGTIYTPSGAVPLRKFSPEPGVQEATRMALARWAGASGIGLSIQENGILVTTQEDWIYLDGKSNCGRMDFVNGEVIVTTKREKCSYFSFESLVLHEVGHAIAGVGGHSVSGIMAEGGAAENRECIDEASLELVCRTADCEVFEPECP
jgi:hypothetical protein